jgi:acyl-CoA oxidase
MTDELAAADAGLIRDLLDGRWRDVRQRARDLAKDPRFAVEFGEDTETQRARVLDRMRVLAEEGYSRLGFPTR